MNKIIPTVAGIVTAVALASGCAATTGSASNIATTGGAKNHAAIGTVSKYTTPQKNAIKSAQDYLNLSGFSRAGLITQLSSKAGDGYKRSLAVFAVNHIKVNWRNEAVESAKSYLKTGSFSRAGLITQLTSQAGEGFTRAQAVYAVNHVGL